MKKQLLSQKRLSQLLYSLGLFLLCLSSVTVNAQAVAGDFRSVQTGNWSDVTTWQVRDSGGAWATPGTGVLPTATSSVFLQNGFTVTIDAASVNCKDLHLNLLSVVSISTNTVNINGKLRAYSGAAETSGADGVVLGTSSTAPVATMITPADTGFFKFVGTTKNITNTGEWSNALFPVNVQIAMNDATQTATLVTTNRFTSFEIVSGILSTVQTLACTGNFTIRNGATVIAAKSSSSTGTIGNSTTAPCGTVTVEAGATLQFNAQKPSIICTAISNLGTTIIAKSGSTTSYYLLGQGAYTGSAYANANVYTNLTIAAGVGITQIFAPATTGTVITGPISINGVLTVPDGCTFNTGALVTLKSTATNTATIAALGTGTINGNVTVERYIPATARQYRLLSPAVTTSTTIQANWQEGGTGNPFPGYGTHLTGTGAGFDATTSNQPSIFTHTNSGAGAWTALTNTSTNKLTAGSPYLVYVRGSRDPLNITATPVNDATTLRATGTLATGNQTVTGLNATADGFSLIGNPYQAQVDMQAVLGTSTNLVTDFYYVLNPANGAYSTYQFSTSLNTGGNANKYLQPGQACFVKTVSAPFATPTLLFTEVNKSVAAPQTAVFRTKSASNILRISLYDTTKVDAVDGLLVSFNPSETNNVNDNDATKLMNFNESIATSNNNKLLSIESRAIPTATDVIPLNITNYKGTSYSLRVQGSGLTETPYLLDNVTNTTTEIPVDGTIDYTYTVDAGNAATTAASRFSLVYAKTLNTNTNTLAGFAIYPNPSKSNTFNVVVPENASNVSLSVSNLLGQKLYSINDIKSGSTAITVSEVKTAGIYLVSLTSEGKTTTTKWIVK